MVLTNPALDFPCNPGTSMPAHRDWSQLSPTMGGQATCVLQASAFLVCLEAEDCAMISGYLKNASGPCGNREKCEEMT